MFTINLNHVEYPPDTQQKINKDRADKIKYLTTREKDPFTVQEAESRVPEEIFVPLQVTRELIGSAIGYYVSAKYKDEKGDIRVPMNIRFAIANIDKKISAPDGLVEFTGDELTFLKTVLESDLLPPADGFVYIYQLVDKVLAQ